MSFVIVFNKPGHLPETDPTDAETVEEARQIVLDYIEAGHDIWHEGDAEEDAGWYRAKEDAKNLSEDGGVIRMPDGYIADVVSHNNLSPE